MKARILRMLTYLIAIYAIFAGLIYLKQDSYIFLPVKGQYGDISKLKTVEEYRIKIKELELHGWLVNKEYAKGKLVIYYGGNAEDVYWKIGEHYDKKGYALLLVNYRGYGLSGGRSSEKSIFGDAEAIYDDILEKYKPEKIILYGRSLGTGVAAYLSSKRKVDALLLVSPFDSMVNMAKKKFPIFPVSIMLKHRFDSMSHIINFKGPVCIIYGGSDNIIPPARTKNLIKYISGKKEIVEIEDADHNDIASFTEYGRAVQAFIGKI